MAKQITLTNQNWDGLVRQTYRTLLAPSIAWKPAFAQLTGSATAALMLSQGYYWSDGRTSLEDGWFFKTAEEWTEELFLSQREQTTAREKLRAIRLLDADGEEIPIWEEDVRGVPGKLHFRINEVALAVALTIMSQNGTPIDGYHLIAPNCLFNTAHDIQKRETRIAESAKLGSRNARLYITESTTETTAENGRGAAENTANGNGAAAIPGSVPLGPGWGDILGENGRDGYRKRMTGHTSVDHAQTCTKQAGEMGLSPQAWVAYYTRLAEVCGKLDLLQRLDDDDRVLVEIRDWAIRLMKLDIRSLEALNALASLWESENAWRADPIPSPKSLVDYQGKKLAEMRTKQKKAAATDPEQNPMIDVEEWLIDTNGHGFWDVTRMRQKRYEKLVKEGRKIRLPLGTV